jgi:hypothetical protein
MHVLRRRFAGLIPLVVALAVGCSVTAASAAPRPLHVAGTWKGTYSGAVTGTFTLRWTQTGSTLSGSITLSNPHGKYGITGRVRGGTISFGAVSVGATYKGTVSGKSMSGTWKSAQGGGSWSAGKT